MLIKHGLRYIRVHPCNVQLQNNNLFENKDSFPSDIDSSTSSLEKGPNTVNDDFQNVKVLFDNGKMCDSDNMFDIEIICATDSESDKNEKGKTKKAKETKEVNRISPANRLKKNFIAARVKIFFVTCIARNKSIFLCTFSADEITFCH